MQAEQRESTIRSFIGKTLLVSACLIVWFLLISEVVRSQTFSRRTPLVHFLEYWAAAQLQLKGENPYSPQQLLALQKSVGWTEEAPMMMWNPPWALVFVMPFGFLNIYVGRALWMAVHFIILFLCADWTWRFYGGPVRYYWMAWIACFTFFPTLDVLLSEQISAVIVLGLVGFLEFEKRKQTWLAGSFLVLIAIKPHLLYLFWMALLLWAMNRKQWNVLLAGGISSMIATAVSLVFNPSVISQYLYTAINQPFPATSLHQWATPTLGGLLRLVFGVERFWPQFVPSIVGIIWFLFYWQQHRHTWDWGKRMPLLILVSLSTTPYAWTFDQVVLLPAVIQSAVGLFRKGLNSISTLLLLSYFLIDGLAIMMNVARVNDFWYFWLVPAMLTVYVVLHKQVSQE